MLDESEIAAALADLPAWTREGDALVRRHDAATFPDAIAIVDRVAVLAETADHHPDIDIRWRSLVFRLSTHSEGGLTERDVDLAHRIEAEL